MSATIKSLHLLYGLPVELLQIIRDFLNKNEYIAFLNTTKQFGSAKKKTLVLDLNREYSVQYYEDSSFRGRVGETIDDLSKQLGLRYVVNEELTDLAFFANVHKLNIYRCPSIHNISALKNLYELRLDAIATLTDVTGLGNIYKLSILNCKNLRDVSPLGNHYELVIANCPVTDVSNLGRIHTLTIRNNSLVRDVSALGNVFSLNLSRCKSITDVSALGKVHRLNLSSCESLEEVNCLGEVVDLNVSGCYRIKNVSGLGKVKILSLAYCQELEDISGLGIGNEELDLAFCPLITSINHLQSVKKLNIVDCHGIRGIGRLESLRNLNMGHNAQITSIDLLPREIETLDISWCNRINTNINPDRFPHLKKLVMYYCPQLSYARELFAKDRCTVMI